MTDILDMPPRTRNEGPLPSRSRPHVPDQETPAAIESARSRAPRKWLRAAWASLLAFLLVAGAYWYVSGVHVTDDPYINVGEGGVSTKVSSVVRNDDVCSSSFCERSPRSRLSPRAIAGRPESRQDDLHLAALTFQPRACAPDRADNWRFPDVTRLVLISLHQG
jgi:hypothetical protein